MAEEEEGEQTKINIHTPAPPSERIWMDVYLDQDGRLAKHDWCLDTGIIKNQGGEVAKPKGFYITILNKMKSGKEIGTLDPHYPVSYTHLTLPTMMSV